MRNFALISRSLLIKLAIILCLPVVVKSQSWGPKYNSLGPTSGGYYEYLPVNYDASKKYPIIIFLHGAGERGNGSSQLPLMLNAGLPKLINQGGFPQYVNAGGVNYSFILIAPQFYDFVSASDVDAVVTNILQRYNVDLSRVYVTGLSMGGGLTWDLAGLSTTSSNRFAAVVPICGASWADANRARNVANASLPVLATHITGDPAVSVNTTIGWVDAINSFNPNPNAIKIIWPGDWHNAWDQTYDPSYQLINGKNVYQWMLGYTRGGSTPQPPPPPTAAPVSASISSSTNVSCWGGRNGSATVSATGGTAPYSYSWNTSPVQTSATASNLAPGTYEVLVKDVNGNGIRVNVTIGQPSSPLGLTVNAGTISTNGGSTNVTLNATGGTAPYSFSGPTSNVRAGTYTYIATDARGCTDSKTVTITEPAGASPAIPAPVTASIISSSNVSCYGGGNGSATVSATGGTAPYSYSWNTSPVQTSATASNLAPGTYEVLVKDVNGNGLRVNVTIGQPSSPLGLTVNAGTISTIGGSTNVTLNATGGTAPYSFSGPTSNVRAGTYTYIATDARGCTDSKTITITEPAGGSLGVPAPVTASIISSSNVSCYGGGNGSATVSASGGTAPYSYSWNTSPVQTSATASNLAPGTYEVLVKDVNGNGLRVNVTIGQPSSALGLTVNAGTISTNGGSTNVTLNATGGTAPYSFSGPTSNVRAGTYTYIATDARGCTDSKTVTITEPAGGSPGVPAPVSASIISSSNVSCYGGSNGSATVYATGGTAPYSYSWNTSPVQTSATASNLAPGTYEVLVKDVNGNGLRVNVTIGQPSSALGLTVNAGTISTIGGSTNVTLNATGGTAPYSFIGPTSNVRAGTYTYIATDARGCTDVKAITIREPAGGSPAIPAPVTASIISSSDVSCYGGSNGSATVSATGGTAPYSYSWNTSPVQTSATASNLAPGTYEVLVKDVNGNGLRVSVTIGQPSSPLGLTVNAGTISTIGGSTNVTLNATGGTAPYSFIGPTSNVRAGTYTYIATDARGCTDVKAITLREMTGAQQSVLLRSSDLAFTGSDRISIKNMTNMVDLTVTNPYMEDLTIQLVDMYGRTVRVMKVNKSTNSLNTKISMSDLPNGTYIISINSPHIKHAKQVIKL